jgi:hypothetical protein
MIYFSYKIKFQFNRCLAAPKWLIEPKDLQIVAGNNISIECKADGEPKPKIVWVTSEGFA